ncbi:MAG: N-acetylmuramoyl-L-alanine amidase [Lachnospiraceae bacterium]|nr:N-acetylmuramoyl-L-alanine amidase [Lachnospiraceae bacterium]
MHTGLRVRTLIYTLFFCAASMGGMLVFADNKAITIANVAQDQVAGEGDFSVNTLNGTEEAGKLRFRPGDEEADYLCIPLEEGIKAENVTMENHYMERQMWIYIKGSAPDYYAREAVSGDISCIEAGSFEYAEDTVLLKFCLTDVYEYKSTMEENHLYIEFVPPGEVYDKILVIDAGGGGEETGYQGNGLVEKDVTLDLVKRLKLLLEGTDIKVYYTRTEDTNPSAESRVGLANAVGADMFISIRLNSSEDTSVYGTEALYNESYFLPDFGSIELADIVERNVVTGISGRGNGLYAAKDSDIIIQDAKVPVTAIQVGYVSNEREAGLLQTKEYRDRIAEGLYQAVLEAFK